jgi:DNA-binding CsgD family transcriptional regulator
MALPSREAPARKAGQAKQADGPPLSAREREVLALLIQGRSNREIATQLGISGNTAKFHLTSIFNKLGVNGRAEAATIAVTRNLV